MVSRIGPYLPRHMLRVDMKPIPKIRPVRLRGKAYTKFRKDVCARAMSRCDTCHLFAPIQDGETEFNLYRHGHVSHIRHHSIGGGDTMDNVIWECKNCHDKRNAPRWGEK